MKNRASILIKRTIAALSSMAKSKSPVLKSKTHRIKAKLIMFSLLRNKKFLTSSISQKLHSFLHHHRPHSHRRQEDFLLNDNDQGNDAILVYSDNARCYESSINPSETQVVEDGEDGYGNYYSCGDGGCNGEKYPALTHSLFDAEGLDFEGSVIDWVKNSKEEAGEEFKLEDEIDRVADLFIRKFRRQIDLQEQDSIRRLQGKGVPELLGSALA